MIKISQYLCFIIIPFISFSQITYEDAFPNIDFDFAVEIQSPDDGSDRLFVVEQSGLIKAFPRDPNVTTIEVSTFLDITSIVSFSSGQEIGLLGLAFHPNYNQNGYFYVYYTADSQAIGVNYKIVLSRFTVNSSNENLADPNSELVLFQFDKNQTNSNHNGGKIAFGPDGYLYISIGDGGGANDPQGNGQDLNIAFGSICRVDVDLDGNNPVESNPDLPNGNYEIPSDNPLVGIDGLNEIYAYGIRNTWKFSFDNVTGNLWGADVGQNSEEEVNLIKNGKNYGWARFEGEGISNGSIIISEPTEFPIYYYDHTQNDVSITGGYVYRGSQITSLNPDINSKYIFGDFVSGRVWALDYNATTGDTNRTLLFRTTGESISSFGVDKNGELYFSDYGNNDKIYKLVGGTTAPAGDAVPGIGEWGDLTGGTINGEINTVATALDGSVYCGGHFNLSGSNAVNNIGMWNDGSGWQGLAGGTSGVINSIKIAGNGNIYAAGVFSEIGGISANNIAVWDGTVWSPLNSGIDGSIATLAIDTNGNLYAAGIFEDINGISARNISVWNGVNWSSLIDTNSGLAGTNNEVRSLAFDETGILYVGGNFNEAGGVTANRIATWDGANWGTLGTGTSGFVEAITTTSTDVYIGGNFAIAGEITVNRIAKWNKNTSAWSALENGLSNTVSALIHDGTHLYAAGNFNLANNGPSDRIIVQNIARWNSSLGWLPLGTETNVGVDLKINTIQFAKDADGFNKIFAAGNFSTAGAISANNLAQWSLGGALNIFDLEDYSDFKLYPNPTSSKVFLSHKSDWQLIDTFGRIITSGKGNILSLATLPLGLYFVEINNTKTFKIIKK
jgi:glucose/arabinose dehydrogenase